MIVMLQIIRKIPKGVDGMSFQAAVRISLRFFLLLSVTGCAAEQKQETPPPVKVDTGANDEFAVRHPAAQGFYPADAQELKATVDDMLSHTSKAGEMEVVAIVTPHAGYDFSGLVAATAFRYAANRSISTVIVIGPSHRVAFPGFAIWSHGKWEMPGFEVSVDADFCKLLLDDGVVKANIEPHLPEHSLEVQLPFIHALFPNARIVPIVAGMTTHDEAQKLAQSLVKAVGSRNDVLLVSTCDLSHYHPRVQAQKLDDRAAELIAAFDGDKLLAADANGEIEIDAPEVIALTQDYARAMGARTAKVLMRSDSGDATGDTSSVVGYGAFAFEK
jgi:MEMO1 family protein